MQLDLFNRTEEPKSAPKTAAIVFRFPLYRRTDLVRATAAELRSRSYDAGRRYWSSHVQKLRRDLRASGLPRAEITSEINAYTVAVRREVFASSPVKASR